MGSTPTSQAAAIARKQALSARPQYGTTSAPTSSAAGNYAQMSGLGGTPRQAPVGPSMLSQPQSFSPGMGASTPRAGQPLQAAQGAMGGQQYPAGTFQGGQQNAASLGGQGATGAQPASASPQSMGQGGQISPQAAMMNQFSNAAAKAGQAGQNPYAAASPAQQGGQNSYAAMNGGAQQAQQGAMGIGAAQPGQMHPGGQAQMGGGPMTGSPNGAQMGGQYPAGTFQGATAQAPASPGMQLNQPAAFKPPAPAAPPPSQDPGYNSSYAAFAAANKPTDPYAGMAKGW